MLRTIHVFIYLLFTFKACCFWTLYQTYKNNEDQIECEITKDLYQIQVNIPINLQSERVEET